MNKHLVFFISAISIFYSTTAQQHPNYKPKYYQVWITLDDRGAKSKGILYEVSDSSILISGETPPLRNYLNGSRGLTEISYSNIELIKARRTFSIVRGAVIGTSIGAGMGLKMGIDMMGGAVMMFGGAPALLFMFPPAAFGAGTGALLGTLKDRIPIRNNIENFNIYKGSLQTYSYMQEPDIGLKQFEHKGFVGLAASLLLPVSDHLSAGIGSGFVAGYRFSNHWGVSISQYSWEVGYSSYNTESDLSLGGTFAGPLISAPISNKLRFDFKPGVGITDATVWVEDKEDKSGSGLGLTVNMSLLNNFSKRGGLLAEAGYFGTRIKYSENDSEILGSFYLNLGYIYKFSRRSI